MDTVTIRTDWEKSEVAQERDCGKIGSGGGERERKRESKREKRTRVSKPVQTIHTSSAGRRSTWNGANDMPEIAGPEWNLSGILRRFRRIRNSEDRFSGPSLHPSLSLSLFSTPRRLPHSISFLPFLSAFRDAVPELTP